MFFSPVKSIVLDSVCARHYARESIFFCLKPAKLAKISIGMKVALDVWADRSAALKLFRGRQGRLESIGEDEGDEPDVVVDVPIEEATPLVGVEKPDSLVVVEPIAARLSDPEKASSELVQKPKKKKQDLESLPQSESFSLSEIRRRG